MKRNVRKWLRKYDVYRYIINIDIVFVYSLGRLVSITALLLYCWHIWHYNVHINWAVIHTCMHIVCPSDFEASWGPPWSWLYGSLQLPVQSVPITTYTVSSNPVHGEVYSMQHYVIKIVSDRSGFLQVLRFPPSIKLNTMI